MNTAEIARARQDGRLWYVVHTHMRCEPTAARNLEQQGFTTYLPLRLRTVRHARQARTLKDAYFPRYLFVALDLERDRWRSVSSTVGVVHFVSSGDRPTSVGRGVVETLMSMTGSDGVLRPRQLFERGQAVRILNGPFAQQIATLDEIGPSDSVRVLLSMMERQVPLRMTTDNLRIIS